MAGLPVFVAPRGPCLSVGPDGPGSFLSRLCLLPFVAICPGGAATKSKRERKSGRGGIGEAGTYGCHGHNIVFADRDHRTLSWEAGRGPYEEIPGTDEARRVEGTLAEPVAAPGIMRRTAVIVILVVAWLVVLCAGVWPFRSKRDKGPVVQADFSGPLEKRWSRE